MIICIKEGFVDLKAPIYISEDKKNNIINFFKENFDDINLKDINEPDRTYGEKKITHQHKWVAADYLKLFSSDSNEDLASDFGLDTAMGPQVKRGTFIMNFLKWKKNKGDIPISKELIQEFLEEVNSK